MEPASDAPNRRVILAVLCVCAFGFPLAAFIVSPLLVDLSQQYGVSIAQAGQLVTIAAVPSAILSLLIGPISDIYGRRPVLVAGSALMGLSSLASAFAPTYEIMAATRLFTGLGASAVGPTTFAAAADLFPYRERGRAYSVLMAALTSSAIVGTPLVTLIAGAWGWRWAFVLVGAATLVAFGALLRMYPRGQIASAFGLRGAFSQGYRPVFTAVSPLAVLMSTLAMSIGWNAFQTYLNAFLIDRYHIATGDLAPVLALAGVGLLIGSQIAGRLGDRVGHKPVALAAIAVATAFMVLQLWTNTNIYVAGAINFVMSLPMGMRFVSMSALISEAVPTARGTMNAMNSAFFNVGIMFGAFGGGVIVEQIGFPALGVLCALAHLVSIVILGFLLVEERGEAGVATEQTSVLSKR